MRNFVDFPSQFRIGGSVCLSLCPDYQVDLSESRQQVQARQFTQLSLEPIPRDARLAMLRDDHTHTWMRQRGSASPDLEIPRPDALPLTKDGAKVRIPPESELTRERECLTRRRISTAVGLSAACDPSCADGSIPHVPSASPYVLGIHESEHGACCEDGKWACP